MLIKLLGVPEVARTKELLERISDALERAGYVSGVRVGFSSIPIRPHNEEGPMRILVTGLDAHGKERAIISVVGETCADYYKSSFIFWLGFEDPALPGQPGESRGRPH